MLYRAICSGMPHTWPSFDQAPTGSHHVFFEHDDSSETPVLEAMAIELAVRWNVPICSLSICNLFTEMELIHHAELVAAIVGEPSPGMPWAWVMDGWDHGRPGLVDPDRMVCLVDDAQAALLRESLDALLQLESLRDLDEGCQVIELQPEIVAPAPQVHRSHARLPAISRLRPLPCRIIRRLRNRQLRAAERALCDQAGILMPPPPPHGFGKRLNWARTMWEQHRETAVFAARWRLANELPPLPEMGA